MCLDLTSDNKEKQPVERDDNIDHLLTANTHSQILLQAVLVKLVNNNKEKVVRILLDSALQKSYIASKCVKDLKYAKTSQQILVQSVLVEYKQLSRNMKFINQLFNISIKRKTLFNETEIKNAPCEIELLFGVQTIKHCDTNMIGAKYLMKKVNWEEVLKYFSVKQIKGILNPPIAAWSRGWWETLARVVKEVLWRNLRKSTLLRKNGKSLRLRGYH